MKFKGTLVLLICCLLGACSWNQEYQPQPSGLLFKLLTLSESKKRIQKNHFVQFRISSPIEQDSIISKRLFIQIPEKSKNGGIVEALSLLNEGESGKFKTNMVKIERSLLKMTNFPHWRGDTLVSFEIAIDKIFSTNEFEESKKEFIHWLRQEEVKATIFEKESAIIRKYKSEKNDTFQMSQTGLQFRKIKITDGTSVRFGTHVKINYKGKFIDGHVFDDLYAPEKALDFYIGQELQVIKGIEEALLLMNEGEEMEVILPSWLAFGKTGSSTGIVPPNTPVVYLIRLQEVY